MLKNLSIPASVEQYPLTAKLDQRGESPGFGHSRGLPKCVVENRDAIGGFTCAKGWKQKNSQQEITKKSKSHDALLRKARWERANIVGDCNPVECVLPRSSRGAWNVAVCFVIVSSSRESRLLPRTIRMAKAKID